MQLQWAKCPECGNGQIFNRKQCRFVTCTACSGRGIVPANVKCACGVPITTISADGFHYCGDKICLTALKADQKEDEWNKTHPPEPVRNYNHSGETYHSAGIWHRDWDGYPGADAFPGYGSRSDA